MPDRRGSRFALEVLFLLALTVALTLANLTALEIAGVMLLGWLIVAAVEWAAWRDEPHYGSGLPPRYYVPSVRLPPPQPLEQVPVGYPEAQRDEAPTWIASAALREEMLGEWPVAAPIAEPEDVFAEDPADPWLVEELPAAPLGEIEPEPEPEPEPVALPLPEPVSVPDLPPEPPPAAVVAEPDLDTLEDAEPQLDVVLHRSAQGTARYSLDPLADPPPRRRFGRGQAPEPTPALDVPARPEGARALPGRTRQD
jgi:hypothetical protein